MVKKLIRHGNSFALAIDKPIMEIFNITNEKYSRRISLK
jgi:hypothetical protein